MFTSIRNFFAPPVFPDDEEKTRHAYLLNFVSLAYLLIVLFGIPLGLLSARTEIANITNPFTLYIGLYLRIGQLLLFPTLAQFFMRRDRVRLGSQVFVYGLWAGFMLLVIFNGGIQSTAFPNTILIMLSAALLLSARAALGVMGATIVVGGISVIMELQGFLPNPTAGNNLFLTYTSYSFVFIAIVVLLFLFLRNLNRALEESQQLNNELNAIRDTLENRVKGRTRELVLAANVAQGLSNIQDLDTLLDHAVVLIQSSFDLYYAQVYLVDESGEFLELRAGTGGAGQALLEQKHRLRTDGKSINSTAVSSKQPIIVSDTTQSDMFQPNPLLPYTRSEMTIPLILGDKAVGALNLQSSQPEEFTDENLPAFQTIAGQLAVAINNAALFNEREQAAASLRAEQDRVQNILESISMPMVISLVGDGSVAYVNDAMAEIIQASREELVGDATPNFYANPEDRQQFLADLQKTGQVVNYELKLQSVNGRQFWALVSARIIDFNNQPAILTTLIDISARREAETTLTKRAAELEAVAQVGSIATSILDSNKLLQDVVNLTKERFELYHAHIYLLDSAEESLILTAGAGEAGQQMVAEGHRIALSQPQSLVARAARNRQGVIVNDVQHDQGFLPNPLLPETRSEMAVPVMIGEEVLGVLDVQSDKTNHFTAEDINIQTTLAAQVAVALQNARQYQNTQVALAETEGLLRVTRVASRSLALEETLSQVLDQVLAMKQYKAGLISIVNPQTQSLELAAHQLPDSLYRPLAQDGLDGTLCDLVYREGKALILNNLEKDAPIDVSGLIARGFRSYQGVPVEARGEVLGTICIFDTKPITQETDFTLMQAIGQQVGVAIQNAMLFTQTQTALAETETFRNLVESSTQAVAIAALDGAISYANPTMQRLLGVEEYTQLQGESITNFYSGDLRVVAELEAMPTVMEKGNWQGEMKITALSGKEIPTLESYALLHDEFGDPNGIAVIITDITERKQAEQAQQRLASALEERLQEVNALQRAMTHEGWQAFFAAKERPIQGYRFNNEALRLISRYELANEEETDLPMSAAEASRLAESQNELVAAAPMMVRGETIGMLGARNLDGQPIDVETQALLEAISAQVAEALERARLFEETELGRQQLDQRAQELQAVAEISTASSTSLDKQAFMDTVTRLTKERFDIYHCNIFTAEEKNSLFRLAATSWRPDEPGVEFDTSVISASQEQSLVAKAARQREAVIVNDTQKDPAFLATDMMPRTRSELAIPLVAGNRVLGVLDIQADRPERFTEEDIRIFTTLASQVAISLQNAELFGSAQRRAEREALINTISQKIQNAPTVQSAMQTAVSELGKALKAKRTIVDLQVSNHENGR